MVSESEQEETAAANGSGSGSGTAAANGSGSGKGTAAGNGKVTAAATGKDTGAGKGDATGTDTGKAHTSETENESDNEAPDAAIASVRKIALESALENLQKICFVLGISYTNKLLEMGVASHEDLNINRVQNQIDDLTKTLEANFKKLKDIGRELMIAWELSETTFQRMMDFSEIISVSDSSSSAAVVHKDFLSTARLKRAQKELDGLRNERAKQIQKEYEKHRDILKQMVRENHITWKCVGYDPTIKAKPEKYIEETVKIKESIKKAKGLAIGRKELVFRIEIVRQLIYQKKPVDTIRGLLQVATAFVDRIRKDDPIMYDGEEVSTVLSNLKMAIDTLEDAQKKKYEKELQRGRLRPRRPRKEPSPDEADEACDS